MIRLFFTGIVIPAVGAGLCVNRATFVCDFSHNQPSEIAVEIEAVLDSRVQARLRKHGIFATCRLRPSSCLQPMVAAFGLVFPFVRTTTCRTSAAKQC